MTRKKWAISLVTCLLLAGCSGMTDEEVRAAKKECREKHDGVPFVLQHLDGRIKEVRCL
jgi:hypothetical protein